MAVKGVDIQKLNKDIKKFIKHNELAVNTVVFKPGTLVEYLKDNSIGIIIRQEGHTNRSLFACFKYEKNKINWLEQRYWLDNDLFKVLAEPTHETLSLVDYVKGFMP